MTVRVRSRTKENEREKVKNRNSELHNGKSTLIQPFNYIDITPFSLAREQQERRGGDESYCNGSKSNVHRNTKINNFFLEKTNQRTKQKKNYYNGTQNNDIIWIKFVFFSILSRQPDHNLSSAGIDI